MEEVKTPAVAPAAGTGTAGLQTQVDNQPTTVSGLGAVSGGIGGDNFIQKDVDQELFEFEKDKNPLMQLMLSTKAKSVKSPIVQHWNVDEEPSMVTVSSVSGQTITLVAADKMKVHAYDTLAAVGVEGYDYSVVSGNITHTKNGKPLFLFVTKVNDEDTFTVKTVNGVKTSTTDASGSLPTSSSPAASNSNLIIPGTKLILLGNAMYETQMEVDPDSLIPQAEEVVLQKRGTNVVISDYFDDQKKSIDLKARNQIENAIKKFKKKGNRTLWIGQKAVISAAGKKGDPQDIYMTEGIRWQFKRHFDHAGAWTYEEFISLAKLFYVCEDAPSNCLALCGSTFLEGVQCIDWENHPEVQLSITTNSLGWEVTQITTVFGKIQFKYEPTLDDLGFSSCAGLIGENRLVHYQRKTENNFTKREDGEESTRTGTLVWDALALKGSCHIWVDGQGGASNSGATRFVPVSSIPSSPVAGVVYCFTAAVTGTVNASQGECYTYDSTRTPNWQRYYGPVASA